MERTCRKLGFDLYGKNKNPPLTSPRLSAEKSKVGLKFTQICDIIKYRLKFTGTLHLTRCVFRRNGHELQLQQAMETADR